ncbi:hypothetical protein HJG60_011246 [Phyllostomus discolor]|uniref:Uncharacterized protein n=1 Tax=Phyllostomus discolor TaxID=89673 RepID=A0A834E564_9CHIR|nr:hypothetical protein HJG60_011246 [Phyllostomus discolor]
MKKATRRESPLASTTSSSIHLPASVPQNCDFSLLPLDELCVPLTNQGPHSLLDSIPSHLINDIAPVTPLPLQHHQFPLSAGSFSSTYKHMVIFAILKKCVKISLTLLLFLATTQYLSFLYHKTPPKSCLYCMPPFPIFLNPPTIKLSPHHSTKSILVRLYHQQPSKSILRLFLLNLCSAFDTIDLSSLISLLLLASSIPPPPGFHFSPLLWPFLSLFDGSYTFLKSFNVGKLQDSVLAHIFFYLYLLPSDLFYTHGFK